MTVAETRPAARFRRFPLRRSVQWALGVGLAAFAVIGAYKTLSLGTFSGSAWRDLVVFGISQGAIYALIALGYTMVYGVLRMINFAHGEVFMFGAFAAFFFADAYEASGFLDRSPVASMAILLVVAMSTSVAVALLLERIAYRPLRNAPRLVPLITAVGASLVLQNTARGAAAGRRCARAAPPPPSR